MEAPVSTLKYPHLDLDGMIAYLEGRLTPEAAAEVDAHLLECELCAAALENLARNFDSDTPKAVDNFARNFQEGLPSLASPTKGRSWNVFFRVAAMVLLVMNIGWAAWYFSGSATDLRFTPYPAEVQKRTAEANGLQAALKHYDATEYAEAIRLLEALPDAPETVELKLLYLGNAYLATGQAQKAIPPLERLVHNPDWILYRSEARRYLGIAYLKNVP